MKKALIAMSGGIDSTAAAMLMQRDGYDIEGVMMSLLSVDESAVEAAKAAADKFSTKLHILDLEREFKRYVVDKFVNEYKSCRTPNPCVLCNRYLKFGILVEYAKKNGFDCLATGHYARIEYSDGRYYLKKAHDDKKDQSYVLYNLKRELLPYIRFPLGEYTKDSARKFLFEAGFENASRKDSQDICFIPNGKYAEFIEGYTGERFAHGNFADSDGNILGEHKGLIRYTIGQRKGLGLALPAPMYVCRLDSQNNRVILGANEDLFSDRLTACDINLIAVDKITDGMRVTARARYNMVEQPARVYDTCGGRMTVEFDAPQRAITPGQAVVLYDGDIVIGGGTIE